MDQALHAGLARRAHRVLDPAHVHREAPLAPPRSGEAREIEHGGRMEDRVDSLTGLAQILELADVALEEIEALVAVVDGLEIERAHAVPAPDQLEDELAPQEAGGAGNQAVAEIGGLPGFRRLEPGSCGRRLHPERPVLGGLRLFHRLLRARPVSYRPGGATA